MSNPEDVQPPSLNRRTLLKGAGVAAVAATAHQVAQVAAQDSSDAPAAMRSRRATGHAPTGLPDLPPLEVIVLNRLAFSARLGDYDAFRALGADDTSRLQAWVDQQLNPQAIDDSDCDARIAAGGFLTLNKTLQQLWADHVVANPNYTIRMLPVTETTQVAFLRAIYSRRQLNEVLADFWHNHFNVYGWDYSIGPVFVHYDRDVIRGNMLGNFRTMLEAVAQSTAMLYYLDNRTNRDDGPNENFARELFELHALGAENYLGVMPQDEVPTDGTGRPIGYVDEDVYEATRCFTGWTVDTGSGSGETGGLWYRNDWHDRFQKWVLGARIESDQGPLQDGRDVLDRLASHPGTGRYIARKLCRRLISDNPPERIVNEAAALFTAQVAAPDQLKQVVRVILLSPEFRATWGEKLKRPFEVLCGALRATDAEFAPPPSMWWYNLSGQQLFTWRAPNGFPDFKEDWSSTMPMLQRWRIINQAIEGYDDIAVNVLAHTPTPRSANQLADQWISTILGRAMSTEDRQEIVAFMADGRGGDVPLDLTDDETAERFVRMVGLILLSPDFQWR